MTHIPPPSTLPPGSIVDTYVRDSGGPQQENSTDQQLKEIRAYCQQHRLTLRHEYADVAKSGGSTIDRDQFNALIDATRNPPDRPAGLILWNYARFSRDLNESIIHKAILRKRGITIHSITDPIPEDEIYGRMVEFFIDVTNEEKRRQTSRDVKRGLRNLVLEHGCVPGTPPRGILRQPVHIGTRRDGTDHIAHRWVWDPQLVPRIQRAFKMRAEGSTLSQIHKETHIFAAVNSYKTFFSNQIYIGILEFGDLVVKDYCEPIIDIQTWNTVQKKIQDYAQARLRTPKSHPRRANSPYLLSGLVYCAICESPMHGNTVSRTTIHGKDEAYRCGRSRRRLDCTAGRIGRRTLEEAVIYTLTERILLPDSMTAMLEIDAKAAQHHETRRQERLDILTAEKKKLANQIANLTRAIAEKGHSTALLNRLTELERQQTATLAEHKQLQNTRIQPIEQLTAQEITARSTRLIEQLKTAEPDTTRQILRGMIHKVIVKRQGKTIEGQIIYKTPENPPSPPFDPAPTMLPIRVTPVGAPLYRQHFVHPIICPPKRTR